MRIPKGTRIIIIEGIAGAGKTLLRQEIIKKLKGKEIFEFAEEELLLGWKHIHVPNISSLRLEFINRLLDYIEEKLAKEKNVVFILERFHISTKILEWEYERDFETKYNKILERIKKLPIHVFIPVLNDIQIKERAAHKERGGQWQEYLKEKLKLRGFPDIESLYAAEQEGLLELVKKQEITFTILNIQTRV